MSPVKYKTQDMLRLTDRLGSRPEKKSETNFWILGIRVEPPTKTISLTVDLSILASLKTFSTGSMVDRKRSWQSSSNRARVIEV